MAAESQIPGNERHRIFISYSRADRQRVEGLQILLQALGHEVFFDSRSILPGMRWQEALEQELAGADVIVVFWTRHAARSKWVKREYESFLASDRDRAVVPVLADTTPLPDPLAARQHADLFPLVNELLATVRDLEAKRVSKREIRKVVLKRLEEEGVSLRPDQRKYLFGFVGAFGLLAPLLTWPRPEATGWSTRLHPSPSYYATAGASAFAGVVVCHTLPAGAPAEENLLAPELVQVPVSVNQSGTDACDSRGLICVSMRRTRITDTERRFFGYSTPTCEAKVVSGLGNCKADFGTDHALQGVVIRRSPNADEDVRNITGDFFCLGSGRGREGVYEFANCVPP